MVPAINGAAIGAGCVIALCCDILVASENAFLSITEVDVGPAGACATCCGTSGSPTRG